MNCAVPTCSEVACFGCVPTPIRNAPSHSVRQAARRDLKRQLQTSLPCGRDHKGAVHAGLDNFIRMRSLLGWLETRLAQITLTYIKLLYL